MNLSRFLIVLLTSLLFNQAKAHQDSTIVAWIDKAPLYSGEFLYAFQKNRDINDPVNADSLLNYLDQYLDFKLKVIVARKAGIDTTQKFLTEFSSYTSEIKKPYLHNPDLEESLIQEAYERLQYEVRAAHILVRIQKNPSPKDTLAAFQRISSLRDRSMNGEDFGTLAKTNSQDGSASVGGDLGYFTGFAMVYPFETAAFETPVGEVSKVIRSQFGYHIVKVLDKREARGRVKTAHIFINGSNKSGPRAQEIINTAYDSLQAGADWRLICSTFSEDQRTRLTGGSLPFYGVGQLPEPLLDAAFDLTNPGEYTKPIRSRFGWHILKLEAKEPIGELKELRTDITNRVQRSGRNQLERKGLVKKLKVENGFEQDTAQINGIVRQVIASESDWPSVEEKTLFTIGKKDVKGSEFLAFLNSKFTSPGQASTAIWSLYEQFEFEQITAYEDSLIPQKYPDHQHLINEYEQGLLLFEIMERNVWNKAIEDSIGLQNFFSKRQKRYPAPERADLIEINSDSTELLRQLSNLVGKELPTNLEDFLKNELGEPVFGLLKIVKRRFAQSDLPIFAGSIWKSGSLIPDFESSRLFWIEEVIPEGSYELDEIKGRVISDYQDFLEEKWLALLRKESKVKVNKKEIKKIATGFDKD